MSEKLVLIDGHSILNRAFFGLPDLTNAKGQHTNAVYGFLNILFKILDEEQPQYLTVAFDVHAPTFRHKMYEAYKGTRKPMAEELREQVPLMKDMLRAMGVTVVEKEGYEADDLLGTIAKQSEAKGLEVSVVSGDRDLLQLATDHIKIRIPKTKRTGTEIEDYYAKDVVEKYQVTPIEFIDVKALMGDTADNIPGVPGIGEKTATNLIVTYGSIENAHEHLEEIKPNRAKENMREHYDMAVMSKELATICIDAPIDYDLSDARLGDLYTPEAYVMCKELIKQNVCSQPVVKCIDYIYDHLHTRITLTQLSEIAGLSPSYLSRLFQKETGQSISSYICEQKINTARNMLLFSSYSSAEIAAILAFPSQSYFSGTFKKKTGMTPSDYRLHGRRREETLL